MHGSQPTPTQTKREHLHQYLKNDRQYSTATFLIQVYCLDQKPKILYVIVICHQYIFSWMFNFIVFQGTLDDGTEFDSSIPRGNPLTFTLGLGQVIKGWDQGLIGMCEGEQRKLVIPPELAYGEAGAPPKIPKSATLTFHVDLVKIERKDEL